MPVSGDATSEYGREHKGLAIIGQPQADLPFPGLYSGPRRHFSWLGRQDSNLGMAESKSAALPLGYAPTMRLFLRSRSARTIAAPAQASNTRRTLCAPCLRGVDSRSLDIPRPRHSSPAASPRKHVAQWRVPGKNYALGPLADGRPKSRLIRRGKVRGALLATAVQHLA
jgi:hypothetical protein